MPTLCFGDISIGEAAKAPKLPPSAQASTPAPADVSVNGGFNVNTDSREQVRAFYNGIYPTSANVPMNSTANVPNCAPGTNATAFVEAVLRRINWFRAMAGIPAAVTFNPTYNQNAQQMAVMISANNALNHNPPTNWTCYTSAGASQAGGNQAIGFNGAEAITGYIWDFGANNSEVGHRRWILLPSTQVMGTGDVPQNGSDAAANSTWVFDASINNPRPATRQPYVAWPPEGYVPYQVVYPYWSLALSNANISAATVTMKSNNVNVAVAIQPQVNGFGENTLVWTPMGLDATQQGTVFPFNGTDTVYNVTVSNILVVNGNTTNKVSFAYNVTVFDPAVPGADYVPPIVNGPSQPVAMMPNNYSTSAINNSNVTSYEWIISQLVSGNLSDNANNGLTNFTIAPATDYSIITNAPDGSGNCFHLCHDAATSQFLQLNKVFYPATNTALSFKSLLGYATSDETARVQASTDGGNTWKDLYLQVGCNTGAQCESTFTPHTLSLSNYAAQPTLLRFNWAFTGGNYFPQSVNIVGWCLENIVVTNTSQLINVTTNAPQTTNIISGNLADSANNGLVNFTPTPPPDYSIITNASDGSGNCFHLCHDNGASQYLQLNETLLPATNTTLSFQSLVGYASSDEYARVQASTNNGNTWQDLYAQAGCGSGQCESVFTPHTLSLANFAAQPTLLRFNWAFTGGNYYAQTFNYVGWSLKNIVVTNTQQILTTVINSTNFVFTPALPGVYLLQVVPVIFNQFPLSPGPARQVTAIAPSGIVMSRPIVNSNQLQLNFTVNGGLTGTFKLLQASKPTAPWTTNTAAVLTTNVSGTSYRFTTTNGPATRFYRIQLGP